MILNGQTEILTTNRLSATLFTTNPIQTGNEPKYLLWEVGEYPAWRRKAAAVLEKRTDERHSVKAAPAPCNTVSTLLHQTHRLLPLQYNTGSQQPSLAGGYAGERGSPLNSFHVLLHQAIRIQKLEV